MSDQPHPGVINPDESEAHLCFGALILGPIRLDRPRGMLGLLFLAGSQGIKRAEKEQAGGSATKPAVGWFMMVELGVIPSVPAEQWGVSS